MLVSWVPPFEIDKTYLLEVFTPTPKTKATTKSMIEALKKEKGKPKYLETTPGTKGLIVEG